MNIGENACERKSRGDTCCDLAWSRRALLVMEASEPSLKILKISIETFKEIM